MTVAPETAAEIRRLFFAEHWKVGTIAAQLHVHADVVRRIAGLLSTKRVPPNRQVRASSLAPYEPFLRETLAQYPRLRSTRLFDMLTARGYVGSARRVRRAVATLRPAPRAAVVVRVETLPGEQAQVDWAHVGTVRVPGGERALWAFVLVLSYSRAVWAELVLDLDVPSVRRSLLRAVQAFGGSTRQWLFDNPKTIVLARAGDAVRFQPALLELCGVLGVQPRLCGVRKPQHKGKVERAIRYLKERFFAARAIASVADGNAQLAPWLHAVCNARPHPVLRERTVADALREERARLLPLPAQLPGEAEVVPVVADRTATVRFDANRYSVPPAHADATRTLVADQDTVRVLDSATVIATHPRCWGRGQDVVDPAHREAIAIARAGAREASGRTRLCAEVPGLAALLTQWLHDGRHVGVLIRRTLALLQAHGAAVLQVAVAEMARRGTQDFGALAALCEQQRHGRGRAPAPPIELATHVAERDVVPHPLEGYDHE